MTADVRRRLGAIAALVAGLFLGLTLAPTSLTGPLGRGLGDTLWSVFGVGALGFPLLGLGIGLAGFDRLPGLDMKRAAILLGGLALLVPFLIGVVAQVQSSAFLAPLAQQTRTAQVVGWFPGFFAEAVVGKVGVAGGLLLGFLVLSALTILTIAWHPLERLERRADAPPARGRDALPSRGRRESRPEPAPDQAEDGASKPRARKPGLKAAGPGDRRTGGPVEQLTPVWELELLDEPKVRKSDAGEAELDALQGRLEETLREFGVEGEVRKDERTTGPVVTQFGVRLKPGVKLNRLAGLADDLALKMAARSIRVARIPGRDLVGVEVPNPKSRVVLLRELLEAEEWQEERQLPVALGLDLEGKPVIADLAKMPHLLIAGATGTGKSIGINAIITSLIYRYQHKEDLRLLMVDPKMVELSMYKDLPHLRHPVVTNNKEAARVLKWAVGEMDWRYKLLEANGVRNVEDFNRKLAQGKPLRNPPEPRRTLATVSAESPDTPPPASEAQAYTKGKLPFVVLVVDELADLMMTVQSEVETPLARLAQKARAIGIHLILATQRPSVNVITGLIKANFPSRIAFRVASKVDSRTILDQNGAEALLGKGDMLFLEPGKSEPMRLQGAYIGTEESEKLMERYREWQAARRHAGLADAAETNILDEVVDEDEEGGAAEGEVGADGERDVLFREAAEACIQNQGGSTSLLQRRLRIGYGRAARIIDQLHDAGILGPPDGSKPREVLIGFDQLGDYSR